VWAADIAAFLGGGRYGRRALAPGLSPDKSWEGLAAAIVAGGLVGIGFSFRLLFLGPLGIICCSVGLAGISQIGDLIESALKRRLGVKDMSRLIPGHGGVLDRLDSLMLVFIVAGLAQMWSTGA
jgi:phosphatidate cytidylyltransferase